MLFSATAAPAQSWWNPLSSYSKPAYGYGTNYNTGMSCANGVCTPVRTNYTSAYGSANCPNGNCGIVPKCGPNGCNLPGSYGNGVSNYRTPYAAPVYRGNMGQFETHRMPMTRNTNYRAPVTRTSPFYR